jgi:uncharacterized protein with NRDE domain
VCSILFVCGWPTPQDLVLAANRDELLARAADPPMMLSARPRIFGGRDRLGGGTWLAVRPDTAAVVAVTNRHRGDADPGRDPALRSRGELPVRLLIDGFGALAELDAAAYNPVNILACGGGQVLVSTLTATTLVPAGVHALTVGDLDDAASAKTVRLLRATERVAEAARSAVELRDALAALLASHETDPDGSPASAACIHGPDYGTVSSSTVVIGGGAVELRYAAGPPCTHPYTQVTMPSSGAG